MQDAQLGGGDARHVAIDGGAMRGAATGPARPMAWRSLWQVPTVLISLALIVVGVVVGLRPARVVTLPELLEAARALIDAGRLDEAKAAMHDEIEPRLLQAPASDRATFHLLVAAWLDRRQVMLGAASDTNDRLIVDQIRVAGSLGRALSADDLERLAAAQIRLNALVEARATIHDLESALREARGDPARASALLRQLVERSLARPGLGTEDALALLASLRADPTLGSGEQAWAALREAALRLAAGLPEAALDHLLVDMRRLERSGGITVPATWGEFYLLLGWAASDLGRVTEAVEYLDAARARLPDSDVRGLRAELLLAGLDAAAQQPESAIERLDRVVEVGAGTEVFLPALALRAMLRSTAGDHDGSLADYRDLAGGLTRTRPREPSRERVASDLVDRHDASVLVGAFDRALAFIEIAEGLFPASETPPDVLLRLAGTNRENADRLIAASGGWESAGTDARRSARRSWARAADAFERHARAVQGDRERADGWPDSLRLAGICHDLAGRPDLAIDRFQEYLASHRVALDPHRGEVGYLLGRALMAERRFEEAADAFGRVIDEDPNIVGTRCHVPLARSLQAIGRTDEAIRRLEPVADLRGPESGALTPLAADHQAVLLTLGSLLHERGREAPPAEADRLFARAIERLSTLVERGTDRASLLEASLRLADALRRLADNAETELAAGAPLSPAAHRDAAMRIRAWREQAGTHYTRVTAMVSDTRPSVAVAGTPDGDGAPREDALQPVSATVMEREALRTASLGRADIAFALGRYDEAVRLYERVVRLFGDEPVALGAYVRIVTAYERLGDHARADAAHRHAMERLAAMPDHLFRDPAALMTREAWEEWLRRRPIGLARVEDGDGRR